MRRSGRLLRSINRIELIVRVLIRHVKAIHTYKYVLLLPRAHSPRAFLGLKMLLDAEKWNLIDCIDIGCKKADQSII